MSTKQTAPKEYKADARVKYKARAHEGEGRVIRYEDSQKGRWIVLKRDDNGSELFLRPSQVTGY